MSEKAGTEMVELEDSAKAGEYLTAVIRDRDVEIILDAHSDDTFATLDGGGMRELGEFLIAAADKIDGRTEPETPAMREWHWCMTVQCHTGNGLSTFTRSGCMSVSRRHKPADVYGCAELSMEAEIEDVCFKDESLVVLHYHAEPNEVAR